MEDRKAWAVYLESSGMFIGVFKTREAAENYPGPRGLECAAKRIQEITGDDIVHSWQLGTENGEDTRDHLVKRFPMFTEELDYFIGFMKASSHICDICVSEMEEERMTQRALSTVRRVLKEKRRLWEAK